jgi:spermidine synthase
MKRRAFLLGFFSVGGQVLLLRELVSSLNGDELFIATALFGWLLSVAAGAGLGGKRNLKAKPGSLFLAGILLLPAMIVAARLCPLLVTKVPGEIIPFTTAALLSMMLMVPVGIISGWLFPVIAREEHRPAASIVMVYLVEGIGAFVGGVVIAALAGSVYSTLGMALVISIVAITFFHLPNGQLKIILTAAAVLLLLSVVRYLVPYLDRNLDGIKYISYEIEESFDTHYSHQSIISQGNTLILLTDNSVEAVYPDLASSENFLIPPLLYKPDAGDILYIGRPEFGVTQLAERLPDVNITSLDPRRGLTSAVSQIIPLSGDMLKIEDDPVSFFTRREPVSKFDIIIFNIGEPDNYKNSRFLTGAFLSIAKKQLSRDGIVFLPTRYDTDRYISFEKKNVLQIIYNTLVASFTYVDFWPGEMTLFFASDDPLFDMPVDTLVDRTGGLGYTPEYINIDYLSDRLSDFKRDKLSAALSGQSDLNSIEKPVLTYYQAVYRSQSAGVDRKIVPFLFRKPIWVIGLPIIIAILFVTVTVARRRRRAYGLFLYFVAGFVSLTVELISFYLYQSLAGSLYSEMAVLIGVFMLGMALGAYYSCRIGKENLEFPALLLLFTAAVLFFATYDRVIPRVLLMYYVFFLFTIALATGSLFVAATDRYYFGRAESNRGTGYALDLVGSSLGALLTMTVILPLIGLPWLLISLIFLIVMALAGAYFTFRQ